MRGLCSRAAEQPIGHHAFRIKAGSAPHQPGQPVVALLGWIGAQDKHLAKYTLFHKLPTIRSTADPMVSFFAPHKLVAMSEELVETVDLEFGPGTPIIWHGFSNGGFFPLWQYALRHGAVRDSSAQHGMHRFMGTIFDSAPAYLHMDAMGQAIGYTVSQPWQQTALYYLGTGAVTVKAVAQLALTQRWLQHDYWAAMLRMHLPAPHMFLYGHADKITDAVALERWIAARATGGVPPELEGTYTWLKHYAHLPSQPHTVASLEFPDTTHVLHGQKHAPLYGAAVRAWTDGLQQGGELLTSWSQHVKAAASEHDYALGTSSAFDSVPGAHFHVARPGL